MADQDEGLDQLRKRRTMLRRSMNARARFIHAMQRPLGTGDEIDSMSSLKSKSVGEGYVIDAKSTGMISGVTMDSTMPSLQSSTMLSCPNSKRSTKPEGSALKFNLKKMDTISDGDDAILGSNTKSVKFLVDIASDSSSSSSDGDAADYKVEDIDSFMYTTMSSLSQKKEQPKQPTQQATITQSNFESCTKINSFEKKHEQHKNPTQQTVMMQSTFEFSNDKKSEMTLGRRIALYLMKKTWYYPNCRQPNKKPSVKRYIDSDDHLSFKIKKEDNLRNSDQVDIDLINDSVWDSFTSEWLLSHKIGTSTKSTQMLESRKKSVGESFYNDADISIGKSAWLSYKESKRTLQTRKISLNDSFYKDDNISVGNETTYPSERKELLNATSTLVGESDNQLRMGDKITSENFAETACVSEQKETVKTASTLVSESDDRPSLQTAWAYFEHVVLPRCIVDKDESDSALDDRNEDYSGDKLRKTKLYSIFTPISQMADFGIGTVLYLYTMRAFMIMTLIAGLMTVPNLVYFYIDNSQDDINWYLRGSAGCNKELNHGADDNECDSGNVRLQQGIVSLATTLYLVISLVIIFLYLNRKESGFQKDKHRVQDYSIVIRNPPADARDPEEWKKYFEDELDDNIKHHVTCCTVAIGNDELVRALVQRREVIQYIEHIVPDNISLPLRESYLIEIASLVENKRHMLTQLCAVCGLHRGLPEYSKLLVGLNKKIIALASKDYPATNVFVTFETEMLKEQAFSALMVVSTRKNRTKEETRNHLFRKQCVLHAEDAMEPSSILWKNLNISTLYCLGSIFAMKIVATAIIVLAAVAVKSSFEQGTIIGAIVVASFNLVFPTIANVLTNYESHKSSGTKQISFYTKTLIFSWVNTAVVTTITTPIASINVLPNRVIAIFIAELITPNIFQLADVCGNFKRHCVAPRMATQEGMNMMMEGPRYDLATRYMNMMKILLLTLWYCSVFPLAFFICSFILCVNYYFDRFSLMRSWKQGRNFGSTIPRINQKFFFPVAIGMMTLISAYFWAGMSFDSLCKYKLEEDGLIDSDINDLNKYCNLNIFDLILSFDIVPFLLWSSNKSNVALNGDQVLLTRVYLWLSVAIFGGLFICHMVSVGCAVVKRFCVNYKAAMAGKNKPYRITPLTIPYIPKAKSKLFLNPLIPCPVMDASGSGSFDSSEKNNLTLDLEKLLQENGKASVLETAFCRISCWTQTSPSLA